MTPSAITLSRLVLGLASVTSMPVQSLLYMVSESDSSRSRGWCPLHPVEDGVIGVMTILWTRFLAMYEDMVSPSLAKCSSCRGRRTWSRRRRTP